MQITSETSKYYILNGRAILTNDDASDNVIPELSGHTQTVRDLISQHMSQTKNFYLYLEKGKISVYKAAEGSGGILELADTNGGVFDRINVDGVKDILLDYGTEGLKVSTDTDIGIQALVTGATTQASVSVALIGHLALD